VVESLMFGAPTFMARYPCLWYREWFSTLGCDRPNPGTLTDWQMLRNAQRGLPSIDEMRCVGEVLAWGLVFTPLGILLFMRPCESAWHYSRIGQD
jgi:hypothetical protein